MNRTPFRLALLLFSLALACFVLPPIARAVSPALEGDYPNQNTAEGTDALLSLTTGVDNTAMGFDALHSNTTGSDTALASWIWRVTGRLNTARYLHTATLLQNGMVLVAAGNGSNIIPSASAEVYDPASRTWTATGSLNTARTFHTATLLQHDMVLVAAGEDSNFNASPSVEVYDPASGTWIATGSLHNPRTFHTATVLQDGTVLVAGGV